MKNPVLKKTVAAVLSILMLCSSLPIFASAVTEYEPIICIGGIMDNILYSNPHKLDPREVLNVRSKDFIKNIIYVVGGVVIGTSEKKQGIKYIEQGIDGIMGPISFNEAGRPNNKNIGPVKHPKPMSDYRDDDVVKTDNMKALIKAAEGKVGADKIFWFSYDWRLDPLENAGQFESFIDSVLTRTGANRVSVLASSNGGVVANAYLAEHREHAAEKVSSVVFVDAPLLGNAVIGDLMKGKIAKNFEDTDGFLDGVETITGTQRGDAVFRFIKADPVGIIKEGFTLLFGDNPLAVLFDAVFKIILLKVLEGEDIHQKLGKEYDNFIRVSDDEIYSNCLAEYLRNIPGLWALVPEEDFDEAMDFIYSYTDSYDLDYINTINAFRPCINDIEENLRDARREGIKISVVANYGTQIVPLTASMDDVADGIESVKYASAGATTPDAGDSWPYHGNCGEGHDHKSPDIVKGTKQNLIDASSCIFPESTWFIKDLGHNKFYYESTADFLVWLLTASKQETIIGNPLYPQYMLFDMFRREIRPYSDPDDGNSNYHFGDINIDGEVTSTDARLAMRYAVKLDIPSKLEAGIADVDDNGEVTSNDARLILRYAVGLEKFFPAG